MGTKLRHFTKEDAKKYLSAHDAVAAQNFNDVPHTLLDAEKEISEWVSEYLKPAHQRKEEAFVIEHDGEFAGWISLHDIVYGEGGVIAYLTEPRFRGKGVATAALEQLMAHAQSEYKLKMLSGRVKPANGGSIRVLEKCGFVRTETVQTPKGKKHHYEQRL